MEDDNDKLNEDDIEVLKEHKKGLNTSWIYSITKFDDQILTISSAALGLSLAFIKDIVPFKDAVDICFYITAIILLALTIMLSLFSHWFSAKINFNEIELIEKHINSKTKIPDGNPFKYNVIHYLNLIMLITLISGISLITYFALSNINHMSEKNKEEEINPLKKAADSLEKNYQAMPPKSIPPQAIKKDTTKAQDKPKSNPKKDTD